MGLRPKASTWLTPERARLPLDRAIFRHWSNELPADAPPVRAPQATARGEVVPPVVDRSVRQMAGALDQRRVLAEELSLGGVTTKACPRYDNEAVGVEPEADRAVGKGCAGTVAPAAPRKPAARDTVAVAFEGDQTPFGMLASRAGQQFGDTRLPCSTKPSKAVGSGISDALSAAQASATLPGSVPCRVFPGVRRSAFSAAVHRSEARELPIVAPLVRAQWATASAGGSGGGRPACTSRLVLSPFAARTNCAQRLVPSQPPNCRIPVRRHRGWLFSGSGY